MVGINCGSINQRKHIIHGFKPINNKGRLSLFKRSLLTAPLFFNY